MHSLQFYEARFRPLWRSTENPDVFTGKLPQWKVLFSDVADLECIPAILLKTDSTTDYFRHGACQVALFKISDIYLREIFTVPFFWIMKNNVLTKIHRRFILYQRSCLYLNADTDVDVIANIGINLLLLLIYFKLTNNVDTTLKYLCKINGNYWKINAIKVNFLKTSK